MSSLPPLSLPAKLRLTLRIWTRYAVIRLTVRRKPLPDLVAHLSRGARPAARRHPPARLSRAVDRSLRVGGRQPTCLVNSLVLFQLLREQGAEAELVIGLPPEGRTRIAHAWVEIDGRDVGPAPGRGTHEPLARFG
ncbi:MAG: lasso peptide biosynthesis B2 protein [Gaiellaceae bacterium]